MPSRLNRAWVMLFVLCIMCCFCSGCMLLALPGQLIGGIFDLLGKALTVADGMPKPPAWMFF